MGVVLVKLPFTTSTKSFPDVSVLPVALKSGPERDNVPSTSNPPLMLSVPPLSDTNGLVEVDVRLPLINITSPVSRSLFVALRSGPERFITPDKAIISNDEEMVVPLLSDTNGLVEVDVRLPSIPISSSRSMKSLSVALRSGPERFIVPLRDIKKSPDEMTVYELLVN